MPGDCGSVKTARIQKAQNSWDLDLCRADTTYKTWGSEHFDIVTAAYNFLVSLQSLLTLIPGPALEVVCTFLVLILC